MTQLEQLFTQYKERFNDPLPNFYMGHLSDEEYESALSNALKTGKPITPEDITKDIPPGAIL